MKLFFENKYLCLMPHPIILYTISTTTENKYKLILLGNLRVGKTSFMRKISDGKFFDKYYTTYCSGVHI